MTPWVWAIVLVVRDRRRASPSPSCMTGAAVAALLGWRLKDDGEEDANDELIKLS